VKWINLRSVSLSDSSSFLRRFRTFFKILRKIVVPKIDAGFGENFAAFIHPLFRYSAFFLSRRILLLSHRSIPNIFYSSHWVIAINVRRSSSKVTVTRLLDVNEKFYFLDRFSKNSQIQNFMKIHPVRFRLFHADRRIDGQTRRI
jgi:hypothetical protein